MKLRLLPCLAVLATAAFGVPGDGGERVVVVAEHTRATRLDGIDLPALGRAVREGRRAEFASHGWSTEEVPDPQSAQTFRDSTLDWSEPAEAGQTADSDPAGVTSHF